MRKNIKKRDWPHQSDVAQDAENVPLHVLAERRAEKHLVNLQTMLEEISAFERNPKVDEDIT